MQQMTPDLDPDEMRAPKPRQAGSAPGRSAAKGRGAARGAARGAPRGAARGPGPSKLSYRLLRAWAKPAVRNAALVYLPLALLGLAGWRVAADDGMRQALEGKLAALAHGVAARPEFAVKSVAVTGGDPAVNAAVRHALGVVPGASSLTMDVEALRRQVELLGVVKRAAVQFDPQGTLRVTVVPRVPAVLYRRDDGVLVLLDDGGTEVGPAGARADQPELPVLFGPGAAARVGAALDLLAAVPDIVPRLRAMSWVGDRRWDLFLDHDLVVKLPADDPVDALSRIMALHYGDEILDRDLAVIDMRLPDRPVLRMTPEAAETYQIRKAVSAIGGEET